MAVAWAVRRLLPMALLWACTSNVNPVFDPAPLDRAVTVGETVTFAVGASDRDGDGVTVSARGLPPGARFAEGVFRWSPLASDADGAGRPWPVTFVAEDARGGRTEARVVITKGFASLLGARDAAGEQGADLAATIRRAARMISTRNDEHDRHA